ncbi:hypothetical protein WA026_007557 [Henosepilachna vigintioctopunctata]|uniref:MADF domain-containing protein n=1 Tax=Henosepilachna vigintioctopunctata TaxID=420089 RepID=A0AAW1UMH2_9CUCU
MSWSKDQVIILIEEYQKHECLYAVKSKLFKNRHARQKALEEIQSILKKIRPEVNISEIKSKFQALKSNFITEYKKYTDSQRSGMATEDIYTPTIWYFNYFFFLLDHIEARNSFDLIAESNQSCNLLDETVNTEDCIENVEQEFVVSSEGILCSDDSKYSEVTIHRPKKKKKIVDLKNEQVNQQNDKIVQMASRALENISKSLSGTEDKDGSNKNIRDEEETLASYLVSRLKQIKRRDIRLQVEEKLIIMIFEGIKTSNNVDRSFEDHDY